MTDNLSPEDRLKTMRAVKSRNTSLERRLQSLLIDAGISDWQMNDEKTPGKPDIVFLNLKLAIFVDGCFWHGCPECNRPLPQKNRDYWKQKIDRNIVRDQRYNEELAANGWTVLRIWGHELKGQTDIKLIAVKIQEAINTSKEKIYQENNKMMTTLPQDKIQIVGKLSDALSNWLKEAGTARSTLAGAVVVIDSLRKKAPIERTDIFTIGGQLVGGRGTALRETFARYGENRDFLADGVTTRSTFKFVRLAESLDWGIALIDWSEFDREETAKLLIKPILEEINTYFLRQQMHLKINQHESPVVWIDQLFSEARERSQGRVEQHLVGAKLQRRMPQQNISAHAAFAADVQTQRAGDFVIGDLVFHVTAVPAPPVITKCQDNLRKNLHPILIIPRDMIERAKGLASATPDLDRRISFVAIEDFIATNIIELAGAENASFIDIFESILKLYNERIIQSETDKSLRIDLG